MRTKQVIVLDTSKGMGPGKMGAQGAHASMAAVLNAGETGDATKVQEVLAANPDKQFFILAMDDEMQDWIRGAFTKIFQGITNEADLVQLYHDAKGAGLRASLIVDNGLTVFNGVPTITAVGIGPHEVSKIDAFTGRNSKLSLDKKLALLK